MAGLTCAPSGKVVPTLDFGSQIQVRSQFFPIESIGLFDHDRIERKCKTKGTGCVIPEFNLLLIMESCSLSF
jgi:hypothetical protein